MRTFCVCFWYWCFVTGIYLPPVSAQDIRDLVLKNMVQKVEEIRKVYVAGNNEASSLVRRKITQAEEKYEREACFSIASKASQADGTITINQQETSGGVNALTSIVGMGSTTVVSAELSTKDGTVVWQDSKQGMPGITSTGAVGGASRVLESLYKTSGCDKKGRRQ